MVGLSLCCALEKYRALLAPVNIFKMPFKSSSGQLKDALIVVRETVLFGNQGVGFLPCFL